MKLVNQYSVVIIDTQHSGAVNLEQCTVAQMEEMYVEAEFAWSART